MGWDGENSIARGIGGIRVVIGIAAPPSQKSTSEHGDPRDNDHTRDSKQPQSPVGRKRDNQRTTAQEKAAEHGNDPPDHILPNQRSTESLSDLLLFAEYFFSSRAWSAAFLAFVRTLRQVERTTNVAGGRTNRAKSPVADSLNHSIANGTRSSR